MGIWIRSQSGFGLLEVNKLDVMDDEPNYFIRSEGNILGSYSTGNEAMVVLNRMQNYIEAIEYYNKCAGKNRDMPYPDFVFQMPPAGFFKEE